MSSVRGVGAASACSRSPAPRSPGLRARAPARSSAARSTAPRRLRPRISRRASSGSPAALVEHPLERAPLHLEHLPARSQDARLVGTGVALDTRRDTHADVVATATPSRSCPPPAGNAGRGPAYPALAAVALRLSLERLRAARLARLATPEAVVLDRDSSGTVWVATPTTTGRRSAGARNTLHLGRPSLHRSHPWVLTDPRPERR